MTTILLHRRTASAWASANPLLEDGEAGFETDTGLLKIGDGVTSWTSLPYQGLPSGTVMLEGKYGAPATGSVQTAFQAAVNDLASKGGGRILLKDRLYDFDSIVWPSIGLNQPPVVIELVGSRMPTTVGFMPGSGLTYLNGGDVLAPTTGTILRSSQTSGSAFGNIAAVSNLLVVMRNLIVRVPANPQWHGIDGGWLTNLFLENVVVDTGRSWGDGSNPLSPGAILQPTNTAVIGMVFPGVGNGGISRARDVLASGFYTGLRHSEHFDGDRVTLAKNVIGLTPTDGYHAARIGRLSLYWNQMGIQPALNNPSNPLTRLDVGELDYEEDAGMSNWYSTVYHINDPSNLLRGRVLRHRVVPAAGISTYIKRRGGAYLNDSTLASARELVDAVGFEGSDSATVLPSSLAGQAPTQLRGTWGVSGQWGYIGTVSGTTAGDLAAWETGLTNPAVHTRIRVPTNPANANLGLCLFAIDANNWIGIFVSTNVTIQKSDTGTWTSLATGTLGLTLTASLEVSLDVVVVGKTIKVYLNGSLRASYTMTAAEWTKYSASTSHGMLAYTATGWEPGGANGGRWGHLKFERAGFVGG